MTADQQPVSDAATIVCRAYFGAHWWDQMVRDLPAPPAAYHVRMRRALEQVGPGAVAEDVLIAYYAHYGDTWWSRFVAMAPEIAAKHVERVQRGLDEAARA